MASIVELYRKHKDLLSPYFKSEEEAAKCERRAEMWSTPICRSSI
jgi:hypothetical protein